MKKLCLSIPAFVLLACSDAAPVKDTAAERDVAKIHNQTLTLDTHVDVPLTYMTEVDPGAPTDLQSDLVKMRSGGLNAAFFIVYTPQGDLTEAGYAQARQIAETRIKGIRLMADAYADRVAFATTAAEVRKGYKDGKLIALVGMENAYPIDFDVIECVEEKCAAAGPTKEAMDYWYNNGVRYVGITHFGHNQWGDSSNPNLARDKGPAWNGLSEGGRELVKQLNNYGIMVDVSHTGKETMMQAADLSRAPIIASHSGVKAVADSPRNLDDEQLRKIRDVAVWRKWWHWMLM